MASAQGRGRCCVADAKLNLKAPPKLKFSCVETIPGAVASTFYVFPVALSLLNLPNVML